MQNAPQYPQQFPPQPPPKRGMSASKVLLIIGGVIVLGFGGCVVCVAVGANASKAAAEKARNEAESVAISELMTEYKANEVRADARWKGKFVKVTGGVVGDVKKDMLDSAYLTLGASDASAFELRSVQCFLTKDGAARAARLNKGETATVSGKVDGLMMNVLIRDCEVE